MSEPQRDKLLVVLRLRQFGSLFHFSFSASASFSASV